MAVSIRKDILLVFLFFLSWLECAGAEQVRKTLTVKEFYNAVSAAESGSLDALKSLDWKLISQDEKDFLLLAALSKNCDRASVEYLLKMGAKPVEKRKSVSLMRDEVIPSWRKGCGLFGTSDCIENNKDKQSFDVLETLTRSFSNQCNDEARQLVFSQTSADEAKGFFSTFKAVDIRLKCKAEPTNCNPNEVLFFRSLNEVGLFCEKYPDSKICDARTIAQKTIIEIEGIQTKNEAENQAEIDEENKRERLESKQEEFAKSPQGIKQQICENLKQIKTLKELMANERQVAEVSGIVNKSNLYQQGRLLVMYENMNKSLTSKYKKSTSKEANLKDCSN
jgi:hypothetical protein